MLYGNHNRDRCWLPKAPQYSNVFISQGKYNKIDLFTVNNIILLEYQKKLIKSILSSMSNCGCCVGNDHNLIKSIPGKAGVYVSFGCSVISKE
jgi:hypothetical protein